MRIPSVPRFIGGFFWWYYNDDMITSIDNRSEAWRYLDSKFVRANEE